MWWPEDTSVDRTKAPEVEREGSHCRVMRRIYLTASLFSVTLLSLHYHHDPLIRVNLYEGQLLSGAGLSRDILIVIIITMKNFNRRNSHGHHGSKRHELAQHTHFSGSHAFSHTLTSTQLQPIGYCTAEVGIDYWNIMVTWYNYCSCSSFLLVIVLSYCYDFLFIHGLYLFMLFIFYFLT